MSKAKSTAALPEHFRPWQPGNQIAVKHGAQGMPALLRTAEIAASLRPLVPTYRECDEPMLRLLAGVLARIELASEWLAEHGIFRDGGEIQPVLRAMSTWENTAARILDRLGCDPLARAQLDLDVAQAAHEETLTTLAARARLEAVVDGEAVEVAEAES